MTDYDLLVYGATGFTGRQLVARLAASPDRPRLRLAVAGRNAEQVAAVAAEYGTDGFEVADATNPTAINALVARTRVVVSTAGPYALYGNALVAACAEQGVHYCDITGETPWVAEVIARHHSTAAATGTRLVPCAGFDSVPSDIGTWLLVEHFRSQGEGTTEVQAFHRGKGGINGGTVASMLEMLQGGRAAAFRQPHLLTPAAQQPADPGRDADPVLPHWQADLGVWAAPFFMGPVNTRVVRRSHGLAAGWQEPWGPDFRYQEYWQAAGGPLGAAEATTMASTQATFMAGARLPAMAGLVRRMAPEPGSGPSVATMDNGWFRCDLLGTSTSGRRARARVSDQGDPGNRATVKMLAETALALTLDQDKLPGAGERGGVLTPATALGPVLVERLRAAGMQLTVEPL